MSKFFKEDKMKGCLRLCIILVLGAMIHLNGGDFDKIIERLKKSVVIVRFTIKVRMLGGEREQEILQRAIMVSDEVAITEWAGSAYAPTLVAMGPALGSTPEIVKPTSATVHVDKDTEIPAKFLGIDNKYGLAYFQLKLKQAQKNVNLQPLEVVDEKKIDLKVGDKVYKLIRDRGGKKFGFPIVVVEDIVTYKFEGDKNYEFSIGLGPGRLEIIADKNLNILGFNYESPLTRKTPEERREGSPQNVALDNTRYSLLFTKSKLEEVVKSTPTQKKVGWLGFLSHSLENISEDLRQELQLAKEMAGLRVASVPEGSPLEMAGIKVEDIIINIGGKKAVFEQPQERNEFFEWLNNELEIGKKYRIQFLRNENGKFIEKQVEITAIEKPLFFDEIEEAVFKFFGIKVKPITYDYKIKNRLPNDMEGVVVVFVNRGDPFEVGGVRMDDIIVGIGKSEEGLEEVKSIEGLKDILKKFKKEKPTEIIVKVYSVREKEKKIKTVRLGERNYQSLEKDLEE